MAGMSMARRAKRTRMFLVLLAVVATAASVTLMTTALDDHIMFFRAPSDLQAEPVTPGVRFRLGGLVEEGSVDRSGSAVKFVVTDGGASVTVTYTGLLPDLFREGQGIVAEGQLTDFGVFEAATVLAKHDETYMPPEVAEALKKQGVFKPSDGADRTQKGY